MSEELKKVLEGTTVTFSREAPPEVALESFEDFVGWFVWNWAKFRSFRLHLVPDCRLKQGFCVAGLRDGRHVHVYYQFTDDEEKQVFTVKRVSFERGEEGR